jgi:DNA-directed RNA polymerase subunit omega
MTDSPRTAAKTKSIPPDMRDDYLQAALKIITDPTILVNVVSRRVKQLKRGNRALVESLEKLSAEDTALREIAEGKITYELATADDLVANRQQGTQRLNGGSGGGGIHATAKYAPTAKPALQSL